jgi:Acetyltransferase (GNAT) domain
MSFTIDRCTDKVLWDQFVEQSPQGSIFSSTAFLAALNEEFELYMIFENQKPVLAVPVQVRDGGPLFVPYSPYTTFRFAIYQGPMFSKAIEEIPLHSGVGHKLKLVDYLLNELTARYERLSFVLHPNFEDLRSFLWFNYHNEKGGRFEINLRYTGWLPLAESTQEQHFYNTRRNRRRDFSLAVESGFKCELSDDLDLLDWLEDLVYERQGLSRPAEERTSARAIAQSALSNGYGRYLIASNNKGEVASAYLFLFDSKCVYHTFAGNHPDMRNTGASTLLLFYALEMFRKEGKPLFDFVGLNSPYRGDFKTSFNAKPKPNYIVSWKRP